MSTNLLQFKHDGREAIIGLKKEEMGGVARWTVAYQFGPWHDPHHGDKETYKEEQEHWLRDNGYDPILEVNDDADLVFLGLHEGSVRLYWKPPCKDSTVVEAIDNNGKPKPSFDQPMDQPLAEPAHEGGHFHLYCECGNTWKPCHPGETSTCCS